MGTDAPTPPAEPGQMDEIRSLLKRARTGDAAVVPRLREVLAEHPDLFRHFGDLARQAEAAWVNLVSGRDHYLAESLRLHAAEMRANLARASAGRLEHLLAERVAAAWLQVQYFSAREAQAVTAGEPAATLQWLAKRQAEAQKLFTASVLTLTTYQKLMPVDSDKTRSAAGSNGAGAGDRRPVVDDLPNRVERFFARRETNADAAACLTVAET